MLKRKIAVMVATHKEYRFPNDDGYMPIHVGKKLNNHDLGITGDDTGENISELNKNFCELTGLYWLWKNMDADIYGLVHYRRYFKSKNKAVFVKGIPIASSDELKIWMDQCDVIVAKQRSYYIDTVKSHYRHTHDIKDLEITREVIKEESPEYLSAFDHLMRTRSLSLYNMFVMNSEHFSAYCHWLFSILFTVEERIPYDTYNSYQQRIFGFLSERLLNVWLEKHKERIKVEFLPVINIEGENKFLKFAGLLKRKLFETWENF